MSNASKIASSEWKSLEMIIAPLNVNFFIQFKEGQMLLLDRI